MDDIAFLKDQIIKLTQRLDEALKEISTLKEKLIKYEHPKNSKNSSIPPSKDENRVLPNQSLRPASNKKVGGQPGHKGHTLEISANPTEIIPLTVDFCIQCGNDLRAIQPIKMDFRQVIEIPPIVPIIREFQSFSTVCSCGHCNKADFPPGVEAPVQYGSSVESMVVYLNSRQYMPFARMQEYFQTVFGLPLSQGTIQNILERMHEKLLPFYNKIKQSLGSADYIGGDETSVRLDGKKGWFWTLQNTLLTFIHCSDNRGSATLKSLFPNGLPNAILVHDAYATWCSFLSKQHQLCLAHLLRELKYFEELYPKCDWVAKLKALFKKSIDWKVNPGEGNPDFSSQLDKLLNDPPDKEYSVIQAFVKRLIKYKDSLFVFLDHDFVPSDNNGSERAIRNAKVKTKVSGQFKSIDNAQMFAVFRSVIDTLIKNDQDILPSLHILANLRPE